MMGTSELCAWLRANSGGIYRPAAEAAEEIEMLAAAKDQHFAQAMENGARANALRAAALEVIAHMEGRKPIRGWLRENEKSRDALDALVRAVGAA